MEDGSVFSISANEVTVEVTDSCTGKTFRHTLPIDYFENSFCLRLRGEGLNGEPAELVFYTDAGLLKIRDLTGGGADVDPCGGHSTEKG